MRHPLIGCVAVVAALVAGGCAGSPPPVVVTTIESSGSLTDVAGDVAVDGVRLVAPDDLGPLPGGPPELPTGAQSQLVVSNYLPESGGYSGDLARAMLADPAARSAVTTELVEVASGFDAVQVSWLKLASTDSAALVDFTADLRDALPEDTSLVLTVIASTDFGGYRERGFDVAALSDHVDRFVLQTYEPAEADLPPAPIDDAGGIVEEIDYLTSQIDADRIDLGVSPLAGIGADEGLRLAAEANLHGLLIGTDAQPEVSVTPS
ncbi:hypothetical protein [Aeromicrobium sp. CF3.5]|uniref:hypothetical protein n=1 Tax=Aeromicrobium sp. CF3.5 TaxID=3373078 RepID=UPI003EE69507